MFEKALVSMDLSPATEALVSALPGLREFGTRELVLVHVTKPFRGPTSEFLAEVGDVRDRLNALAAQLEELGFSVTVSVPTGAPEVEVAKQVRASDPDIVVVGSRSHTRIREAFIGSVAWDIVRKAGRPVLLQKIEPNRADPEAVLESHGSGLPKHVIYPTDFSATATRARPWLEGLVQEGVPSFTLLHVMADSSREGRREAESLLEKLGQELREQGAAEVTCRVRVGTPYEEILKAGGASADRLVVMGTHGRGFLPGVVLGSVGRQVVRHATARVLLVSGDESKA